MLSNPIQRGNPLSSKNLKKCHLKTEDVERLPVFTKMALLGKYQLPELWMHLDAFQHCLSESYWAIIDSLPLAQKTPSQKNYSFGGFKEIETTPGWRKTKLGRVVA